MSDQASVPSLQIHGLTAGYGSSPPLFVEADLELLGGKMYGLWAPNGSGKTSLCQYLLGLKRFRSGRIQLGRHVYTGQGPEKWRKALQEAVYYVPCSPDQRGQAQVRRYLLTELKKARQKTPEQAHQVQEILGELDPKAPLTVLMCALGAMRRRRWMILDEPFAQVPSAYHQPVLNLIHWMQKDQQTGFLILTHKPEILEVCDAVLTLKDQKIVSLPECEEIVPQVPLEDSLNPLPSETPHSGSPNATLRSFNEASPSSSPSCNAAQHPPATLHLPATPRGSTAGSSHKSALAQTPLCGPAAALDSASEEHLFLEIPEKLFSPTVVFFDFFDALFKGRKCPASWPQLFELLDTLDLPEEILSRTLSQVSHGQGQKLRLMVGLLCRPEVLILPQPLKGLDAKSLSTATTLLKEIETAGTRVRCV